MKKYLLFLFLLTSEIFAYNLTYKLLPIDKDSQTVEIDFKLEPNETLYKDSFFYSANNPNLILSDFKADKATQTVFDEAFSANKEVYKDNFKFTLKATRKADSEINSGAIDLQFIVGPDQKPKEEIISLSFDKNIDQTNKEQIQESATSDHQEVNCATPQPSLETNSFKALTNKINNFADSVKKKLSSFFNQTTSYWIKFLIALLLGILLSLTPCIYPMIPITVGVLQINKTKSILQSFLMSLAYTFGISTTFALFGLIAALGSCIFGELQGSPLFVLPLVLLLLYFGISMLGFYEIYIPRFLQPKDTKIKGGSYLSVFLFGAISGTVASPCLSPGLLLILNYVSTISASGSFAGYFESFALLFIFGIGSSLPLLIIGTFSGWSNLLPQAGMWMVEIKKLFGLMLIAMALYHLTSLERFIPWYVSVWLLVLTLFILGIYYFYDIRSYDTKSMTRYKSIVGTGLIILGCFYAFQGFKAVYDRIYHVQAKSDWLNGYTQAKDLALKENKKLFIDIGSSYCAACKSVDKDILSNSAITNSLKNYIPVKILSDVNVDSFEEVKKHFGENIKGFPTLLIINPADNKIIKSWGSEISEIKIEELAKILDQSK